MMYMKILIVSNNPSRPSYRQRIGDFVPYLNDGGIETDVFRLPASKIEQWKLFKSGGNYNAVLLHKKCLNFIDAKILRRYAQKIIYDFDDAVMYSPNKPECDNTSHFRLFKRTALMVDCMIAGNEYLAEHARRFSSNVHLLPTGLQLKPYVKPKSEETDSLVRLAWIGSASTLKYLADLKPVLEDIGKRNDNIVLRIIADSFFELDNMRVEKHSWSLETQVADLQACDIGLAPLPDNRFTRGKCGFKILQYFAAGLPVAASPVGVNRDLIEQSRAGFLAAAPSQWKESIVELMKCPDDRNEMATNAKQFIRQYDTKVLAERLYGIISSLIK